MPKPISIKDIAKAAGVSHPTVSRALAESTLVAPATRMRIQRIARDLGYTPSAIARGLVSRRTGSVGLVVTTIADPFIAEVAQGVEQTALDSGYSVILCNSNAQPERELACVRSLHEKRVDGIIVTSSRVGSLYVDVLAELGVPIVLINNQHAGPYVYSVRNDDLRGGELVAVHLAALGHRRIGYIAGPYGAHSSSERLHGCRSVLEARGLDLPDELVAAGNGNPDGGQAGIERLLRAATQPTAIFCYNDMTAFGALAALKTRGVRVPQDVSLIGYDDIAFARLVDPPLTTVAQAKHALGQRAMRLLLDLLSGASEQPGDIVLAPALVERGSSGAAAGRL